MVAVIKPSHSMHRIFNYNENKVKGGIAECIGAENFPLNADEMSLKMKLGFLLKRTELRKDVERKNVHISLNFDPSEKHLSGWKMMEIAKAYMQKIGFGEQPYLVYQHHDAGHPHIHIVTTNIQSNGNRIDLHHLGIRKSEPARKEIEKIFGLVVADEHSKKDAFKLNPVDAKKVQYGRTETRRAIANVLDAVLDKYKYTSLSELNAVLKLYNVMADRGSEQSKIFESGGLVYRVLDKDGKPLGVPVKASLFYNKPTLKFLGEKFYLNKSKLLPHKSRIKNEIDKLFIGKTPSLHELVEQLERKGINVSLRQNDAGLIYGITYVDHQTKCVFNGSTLGKQYSAKAIQERCLLKNVSEQESLSHHPALKPPIGLQSRSVVGTETKAVIDDLQPVKSASILNDLLQPEQSYDWLPKQLKRKRKKKKRKNISDNR